MISNLGRLAQKVQSTKAHQVVPRERQDIVKPKVAVCFFGITRSLSHTIDSIERNVIGPARATGEVRIYAHFFRQTHIDNPRSCEKGVLKLNEHLLLSPNWLELEDPDIFLSDMDFEALKSFRDVWNDGYRSLRNLAHQLHSLDRVTTAALAWDPDICIFVRPDLIYWDSFLSVLADASNVIEPTVYIPSWQHWSGLNDRFSVCVGKDAIQAYGTRKHDILPVFKVTSGCTGERLVKHSLITRGINVRPFNARASRVRIDGSVVKENFRDPKFVFPRIEKFLRRQRRRIAQPRLVVRKFFQKLRIIR